jgi:hypothetical protein
MSLCAAACGKTATITERERERERGGRKEKCRRSRTERGQKFRASKGSSAFARDLASRDAETFTVTTPR